MLDRQATQTLSPVAPVKSKYWQNAGAPRARDIADGNFVCTIPGCGKRSSTQQGLSHHKLLTHREGTFTAGGFDCHLCPRSFDRGSARSRHLSWDHDACPRPYPCPVCSGVWPSRVTLLRHMSVVHPIREADLPVTCPLCVNTDLASVRYTSEFQIRYHFSPNSAPH